MASIQIANPVSFIAQKILIHEKRYREDRAKDILYMHDTVEVFGASLPELSGLWRKILAPEMVPRQVRLISKLSKALFAEVTDDIRRAAEISAERVLSPEVIRTVCNYGFTRIFGPSDDQHSAQT